MLTSLLAASVCWASFVLPASAGLPLYGQCQLDLMPALSHQIWCQRSPARLSSGALSPDLVPTLSRWTLFWCSLIRLGANALSLDFLLVLSHQTCWFSSLGDLKRLPASSRWDFFASTLSLGLVLALSCQTCFQRSLAGLSSQHSLPGPACSRADFKQVTFLK